MKREEKTNEKTGDKIVCKANVFEAGSSRHMMITKNNVSGHN